MTDPFATNEQVASQSTTKLNSRDKQVLMILRERGEDGIWSRQSPTLASNASRLWRLGHAKRVSHPGGGWRFLSLWIE